MIDAVTKQWALYWPTAGRARMVHAGETHEVRKGTLFLLPPHTTFSTDCRAGFAKWYIHFDVTGVGDALRPGVFPIRPSRRMLTLLASTCPATIEKGRSSDHTAATTLDLIDLLSLVVRDGLPKLQAPGFFGVDADSTNPNDALGRECHTRRKRFDLSLEKAGLGHVRRKLYGALAKAGLGREAIIVARKKLP
jgi:hypothetical protein